MNLIKMGETAHMTPYHKHINDYLVCSCLCHNIPQYIIVCEAAMWNIYCNVSKPPAS